MSARDSRKPDPNATKGVTSGYSPTQKDNRSEHDLRHGTFKEKSVVVEELQKIVDNSYKSTTLDGRIIDGQEIDVESLIMNLAAYVSRGNQKTWNEAIKVGRAQAQKGKG
jgi:hypothetical protein